MKKCYVILFLLVLFSLFNCNFGDLPRDYDANQTAATRYSLPNADYEVYVKTPQYGGSDSNPGTQTEPKATIQAAIDMIPADKSGIVRVAAGKYSPCKIIKRIRLSLLGGYNTTDWEDRYIGLDYNFKYRTVIEGGVPSDAAVDVFNVSYFKIEGFRIYSNDADTPAINILYAGVEIKSNYIYVKGLNASGLVLNHGTGWIYENQIFGGKGSSSGIYAFEKSVVTIFDNLINGGDQNESTGIKLENSEGTIEENYIVGGNGETTIGINIIGSYIKPVEISGNTIFGGTGTIESFGIVTKDAEVIITNNPFIWAKSSSTSTTTEITKAIFSLNTNIEIINSTIYGGLDSNYSYGIHIQNEYSFTTKIENNIITGGCDTIHARGIKLENTTATISHNEIKGGVPTATTSAGLEIRNSTPTVINNTIDGGGIGVSRVFAIMNYNSNSVIVNNTINGGSANMGAYGIYNVRNSHPQIVNNIIFVYSSFVDPPWKWGIYNSYDSYPFVSNNDIWIDNDLGTDYIGTNNNINIDPYFQVSGNNFLLTANSPISVTEGGIPFATSVDKDYKTRTIKYSIGAYEYDN